MSICPLDGGLQDDEKQQLFIEQLPLVRYVARGIHGNLPRHVPLEDLIHAGVIGLIDALQKFDSRKHVKFGSYAKFRIRGAILDSLREMDWSPRDLRRQARRLEEAQNKLRAEFGREPTEPELAQELELTLNEFHKLVGQIDALEVISLRSISPRDGQEEDLGDYVSSGDGDSPLVACLRSEVKELLDRAMSELPEKERQVVALYYFEERTMKEVGLTLGVGESRVSQIHSVAMMRLRTRMSELTAAHANTKARAARASD